MSLNQAPENVLLAVSITLELWTRMSHCAPWTLYVRWIKNHLISWLRKSFTQEIKDVSHLEKSKALHMGVREAQNRSAYLLQTSCVRRARIYCSAIV